MPAFSGDTVVKNVDEAEAAPLADAAAEPPRLRRSPTKPLFRFHVKELLRKLTQCCVTKQVVTRYITLVDNSILMRKWVPRTAPDDEWASVNQIVVPTVYRQYISSVTHERQWPVIWESQKCITSSLDTSSGQG